MKGFVKVTAISPNVSIGDINMNVFHIENSFNSCRDAWDSDVILYPELCLTGYSAGDLFTNNNLMKGSVDFGIKELCGFSREYKDKIFIVGAPIESGNSLFNCAVVICNGEVLGIVPKCHLPNYSEFYEERWFKSGVGINKTIDLLGKQVKMKSGMIFSTDKFKFGVEICEDLWAPIPPSSSMCLCGAEIIFNLSASNELAGKNDYLMSLISNQSARCICGYVYSSAGWGESSTDLVYTPKSFIYENGRKIADSNVDDRFIRYSDYLSSSCEIDLNKIRLFRRQNSTFKNQSIQSDPDIFINGSYGNVKANNMIRRYDKIAFNGNNDYLKEIFNIQVTGLIRRLEVTSGNIVLGVSGGSDSTLALLVAYEAMKRRDTDGEMIYGITMPCYGTTERTKSNSLRLMELLNDRVIPEKILISKSVTQHRKDIGLDKDDRSITYENCQARERTQVLMDYANKVGGIVLGTGDLSELALGWCTYNADHMSMYNVNGGVPKSLVKSLIRWYIDQISITLNNKEWVLELGNVLGDILDTPVSPELLPDQVTEDNIGPYELHEFFLYHILRSGWDPETLFEITEATFIKKYSYSEIEKWLNVFYRRFTQQQFKRSCLPDGPKVGTVSLSPRGDWRMPSDIQSVIRV